MVDLGKISVKNSQGIITARGKMYKLVLDCFFNSYKATQITSMFSELITYLLQIQSEVLVKIVLLNRDFNYYLHVKIRYVNLEEFDKKSLSKACSLFKFSDNGDNSGSMEFEVKIDNVDFIPSKEFIDECTKNLAALSRDELLDQLKNANEEVNNTLNELTETQSYLVQNEKMAVLGQLTANIAHEVNNPLGAIQASVGNIRANYQNILDKSLALIPSLDYSELSEFNAIINESLATSKELSSKEQRKLRREYVSELDELGVEDSDDIAELLLDLKIYEGATNYPAVITGINAIPILETVYYFTQVVFNTKNIELAVKRATRTVFAMKKYSHTTDKDVMEKTNMVENLNTVLTIYHNKLKQINLVKDFSKVPITYAYADELGQVWTNLIYNALQAIDTDGTITVKLFELDDSIHVSVTDNGHGIPLNIQKQIFKPFFTTKAKGEGSGLGLDIVRKIVEKHDGIIELDSEVGVGTTFSIILPILNHVEVEA